MRKMGSLVLVQKAFSSMKHAISSMKQTLASVCLVSARHGLVECCVLVQV